MSGDLLHRKMAPIPRDAWAVIDDEARRVLKLDLAARKLVDFDGPYDWDLGAVNLGRVAPIAGEPAPGVSAALRRVQPLVELRTAFRVARAEVDAIERGAEDPELASLVAAASHIARAEDRAVFHGYAPAGIVGIIEASPHPTCEVAEIKDFPRRILEARERLRRAGVDGPYALALGSRAYEEVFSAAEDGYPIVARIEGRVVDGPIVHAPGLDGAVLLSVRGGDYRLTVGQDLSIGYAAHDAETVDLFLTESFTFNVLEATAAVHLRRP